MSNFAKGLLGTLVVGLLVGIVLLLVEYGVFVPSAARDDPGSVVANEDGLETPAPVEQPTTQETAEEVAPAPEPVPAPAPVVDQSFTDYRIEVVGKKLSATEYSASSVPGYYMKVFTASGEIKSGEGCYAHMELYNNDVLLTTGDMDCGLKGGWSTNWWPNDTKLNDGTVRVTASITSDWGATAFTETTFTVRKP